MSTNQNQGLKANVISMYKSRFERAEFFRPKIVEDLKISGKSKEHIVDIYFEFIQMNNLERTIIKIIENTEVKEKDIWEFSNTLKDLRFFAKGIVYYDNKVSDEAIAMAKLVNIDLKRFNFGEEVRKNAMLTLKTMLPDQEMIGDPFWVAMEISRSEGNNIGNFVVHNDSVLLYLSKKQASKYCCDLKENVGVFGISQNHLRILLALQEKGLFPNFRIAFPEFEQMQEGSVFSYAIPHEKFKKLYLRGEL